ncbi:major royal jelly protein 2 isoform X2 [Monomorium pharaonis]|uniref:major royal jelly protein 2 isoform X2 n=1 Tax=Monomorium pharaonis TaxID=307658 RepID=UPI001745FD94|nr:major royal jelly protein 2 isoform X2 [Monomorium pharaonis]
MNLLFIILIPMITTVRSDSSVSDNSDSSVADSSDSSVSDNSDDVTMYNIFKWKYVDYIWENEIQKQNAINSGNYVPVSVVLYDVDKSQDGKTFVTAIRDKGVPASLMTVSDEMGPGGPLLNPYPDWSWYEDFDCKSNRIISVYRVDIKCNRLYVLDCGEVGETAVCPPKLLIFDLKDDRLIRKVTIPSHIANNASGTGLLVTPFVHVHDCRRIRNANVFMADINGFGIAIYNENSGKFCRIESTYMKPTNPNFNIAGQSFYLNDGPIGLAMINEKLFYSVLAGNKMYKMENIYDQQCPELSESMTDQLTQLAGTLSGQTGPIASKKCAIFFSNIPKTSILCQDTNKVFNSTNTEVIVQDSVKLQFLSGMKIRGGSLIGLSNRFQRFVTGTSNLNEINFRILSMHTEEIETKTKCFASCNKHHHKHKHCPNKHNSHENHDSHEHYDSCEHYSSHEHHGSHEHDSHEHHGSHEHDSHENHNKLDKNNKFDSFILF